MENYLKNFSNKKKKHIWREPKSFLLKLKLLEAKIIFITQPNRTHTHLYVPHVPGSDIRYVYIVYILDDSQHIIMLYQHFAIQPRPTEPSTCSFCYTFLSELSPCTNECIHVRVLPGVDVYTFASFCYTCCLVST